jgi:cytochrome c biogenesis factor
VPADIASQYWLLAITILVGPAAGVLVAAASRRWRRDRMTMIGQTLTTIVVVGLMLLAGAYFQQGDMAVAEYATSAAMLFAFVGGRRQ